MGLLGRNGGPVLGRPGKCAGVVLTHMFCEACLSKITTDRIPPPCAVAELQSNHLSALALCIVAGPDTAEDAIDVAWPFVVVKEANFRIWKGLSRD